MRCGLCKNKIRSKEGAYYWVEGKCVAYCRSCSPNIESMSRLPEVMIVPITPKSFQRVVKKMVDIVQDFRLSLSKRRDVEEE